MNACENPTSFVDVVLHWAACRPVASAYTYHRYPSDDVDTVNFEELSTRTRAIASELQKRGLQGRNVLLLFKPGLEFIPAFLACFFAGAVAIPMYPPNVRKDNGRLLHIMSEAEVGAVLTTGKLKPSLQSYFGEQRSAGAPDIIAVDEIDMEKASSWRKPRIQGSDTAFIQYTSGSTQDPKGVVISHDNLLSNEQTIKNAFGHDDSTVVVGWLPLFHDMGLIGNVLQPLYLGTHCILMDPLAFIQRPIRWLRLISRYRATTSGGPSFGYDHCVRRIQDSEMEGVDLSCWTLAFCGSEPVRSDVLLQFGQKFSKCGFQYRSLYPCYGLAEATLFVTGVDKGSGARQVEVDSVRLAENVIAVASEGTTQRARVVSCGYPRHGEIVRIVEPNARVEVPDGVVGEIWVCGRGVAHRYWKRAQGSEEALNNSLAGCPGRRFARTGDLGFVLNGELFITGRIKDLIIIRGRNHYPQDIEETATRDPNASLLGGTAAFSVVRGSEEKLILVQEVAASRIDRKVLSQLEKEIGERITREHGLALFHLLFVKSNTIPKTSSGKTQRLLCRQRYESGLFHQSRLDGAE